VSVLALLPAMLLAATCLPSLAATTPKEAAALGRSLADAFNERSVDAFMESVDVDAFTGIVLRELELATTEREAIRRRMPGAVRRMVETGMRAVDENQGKAKYLRSGVDGGRPYALIRLDLGDEGVDYIKYYAASPRAVEDWYVFTAASLYSSSVRFNLATIFKNESALLKLFGLPSIPTRDARVFIEMRDRLAKSDYGGAFKLLDRFPEEYRSSRQWAVMRVTYGGRAGKEHYSQALRHLASRFGGDPDLQLLLIDHYFYEEQFGKALAAVAGLEQAVGGEDASTNGLKGSLLAALKRPAEAEAACRRGILLEADFKSAYWCLVSLALERNDGRLAVDALTQYEKAFDVRFDPAELARQELYQNISKSREFAAWASKRARK
jgi:hypothetical protein